MPTFNDIDEIDTVRASRGGHTFHERWAARRALQLVFPKDKLFAIAVEGLSPTETAKPGNKAEEVADLVLYYGKGDNFAASERLETVQFKYKLRADEVTASYLRKTIEKFCATIVGYEKDFTAADIDTKISFIFVTNASFFLGPRDKHQESLQPHDAILRKLRITDREASDPVPLYGRWTSPDGVSVSITSALSARKGVVQRCANFSKKPDHDFLLPEFFDGGYFDRDRRRENPFEPIVWAPDPYGLGIDQGDELAAHKAASRPRLGLDLTQQLSLTEGPVFGEWHDAHGGLALKSQVWGMWTPDPDEHRHHQQSGGEILRATSTWLAATLADLRRRLVTSITLRKYPSSRSYDKTSGAKLVIVALRADDGSMRFWHAKKASRAGDY